VEKGDLRRSTSSASRTGEARRRVDDSRCAGSLAGDFTIVLFHRFATALAIPHELLPVIITSGINVHDPLLWALVFLALDSCLLNLPTLW